MLSNLRSSFDCPLLNCKNTDGTPHRTTQIENIVSHVKTMLVFLSMSRYPTRAELDAD